MSGSHNPTPGWDEFRGGLQDLPDNIQKRIARAWTKKWAVLAYQAAVKEAPLGKTKNLIAGLRFRNTRRSTLQRLQSLARSVVIGAKPAYHYHLVNLGTRPRVTKGGVARGANGRFSVASSEQKATGKRAFRGSMPRNQFVAKAAIPLLPQAEADLKLQVARNIQRMLRKRGG